LWKTGKFITSDVRNENFFSADNWGVRSSQLLHSVLGLSDASWNAIYDNALATFKTLPDEPDPIKDSAAELIERFEMLRSDPDYPLPEPSIGDGDDEPSVNNDRNNEPPANGDGNVDDEDDGDGIEDESGSGDCASNSNDEYEGEYEWDEDDYEG
jgi:hypothetical protein